MKSRRDARGAIPVSVYLASNMERTDQPQRHEERKERDKTSSLFALFVVQLVKTAQFEQDFLCKRSKRPDLFMLSAAAFPPRRSFARTSASSALKTQRRKCRCAGFNAKVAKVSAEERREREPKSEKEALNRRQRRERRLTNGIFVPFVFFCSDPSSLSCPRLRPLSVPFVFLVQDFWLLLAAPCHCSSRTGH